MLLRIADIDNLDVARQIAASARILADEATRRRSRHPERAHVVLCAGPSDRDRDAGARQPIAAAPGAERPPGRVFVLRADLIAAESRALADLRRTRRAGRRSTAACPINSNASPKLEPPSRRRQDVARRSRPSHRPRSVRPISNSSTGSGGFAEDGKEYVTILGAGPIDAGALDQRHRQSGLRLPDRRPRAAATPGPSTAARTSSRPGRTIPSAIPRAKHSICETRNRRRLEPDRAADPRPAGDLCRASWPGLQPLRAHRARRRLGASAVRAARRSIKISRLTADEQIQRDRAV